MEVVEKPKRPVDIYVVRVADKIEAVQVAKEGHQE
jgi:hypothetical protein